MENLKITSHEVSEALEQVRAGFTVSRNALSAITILHPLKRKDEKWSKKFMKVQGDYHKFLMDSYKELEGEYDRLLDEEKKGVSPVNNTVDTSLPQNVIDEILDPKNNYKA